MFPHIQEESSRLGREQSFHDGWADSIDPADVLVDEFFEACTSPENRIILQALGDVRGKRLLELGCGAGEASVYLAKRGAIVTATDISDGMLSVTQEVASHHGVSLSTVRCGATSLPFPDSTFDVVYAANLLHHVDIVPVLQEVSRVLRGNGLFVSWDPLAHNPAINQYRRIATKVRTPDEHPLRMQDLRLFKSYFKHVRYETTWFLSLWIFIRYYFIDKIDPNRERYWKKILVDHKSIGKTYRLLERIDLAVLRALPFLKRYCWNIVVISSK